MEFKALKCKEKDNFFYFRFYLEIVLQVEKKNSKERFEWLELNNTVP